VAIENIKGTLSRDLQPECFFPSAAKSHRYLNILIDITEIFKVWLHISRFLGRRVCYISVDFFYKVDLVCGPLYFWIRKHAVIEIKI